MSNGATVKLTADSTGINALERAENTEWVLSCASGRQAISWIVRVCNLGNRTPSSISEASPRQEMCTYVTGDSKVIKGTGALSGCSATWMMQVSSSGHSEIIWRTTEAAEDWHAISRWAIMDRGLRVNVSMSSLFQQAVNLMTRSWLKGDRSRRTGV